MAHDVSDQHESDIRRRAAWLLGMLALVAALFVTVMVTFFNSGGGSPHTVAGPTGPTGPAVRVTGTASTSRGAPSSSPAPRSTSSSTPSSTPSSAASTAATRSCPGSDACALQGDPGDAVRAINDFRDAHGKASIPGSVTKAAQQCALSNGGNCAGGWALTYGSSLDGAQLVKKIAPRAKLLTNMNSIQVGWAYDPSSKLYYLATIRHD